MLGFLRGDFVIFKPKRAKGGGDILNIEFFFPIRIHLKNLMDFSQVSTIVRVTLGLVAYMHG
jgi:hypothetical protein